MDNEPDFDIGWFRTNKGTNKELVQKYFDYEDCVKGFCYFYIKAVKRKNFIMEIFPKNFKRCPTDTMHYIRWLT